MKTLDFTGLKNVGEVTKGLQQLLSEMQVHYTNLRGFHWNIVGKEFFLLHEKFEEMYDEIADQIDEVAERILMLGETPEHKFSEYVKVSKIKETGVVTGARETVEIVLDSLKTLIATEREILEVAGEANDEATVALMGDYISGQEKLVWFYVAYLK